MSSTLFMERFDLVEVKRGWVPAHIFSPEGQKEAYQKGWEDAVEGRSRRFFNPWYKEGYQQGLNDLAQ